MHPQVTINGRETRALRARRSAATALVIIALTLLAAGARAAPDTLTTAAPPAPVLATVVVEGSSAYFAPQLFDAYRDQIGKPISREGARAVADALIALYERDGFVRPEVTFDDSLTGRGVLRVRVYEAQVSRVLFEGDTGRYREALQRIGTRLEQQKPLRRDDVPGALRAMRRIAGMSVNVNTRRDTQTRNTFELLVKAEFAAVNGVVRMNNRGTDQIGPAFMLGQVFINGLMKHEDLLGLIFAAATEPGEYHGGGLYFDTALGDGATHGNILLFRSHSAPTEAPDDYPDEYTRQRAAFRVTRALRQESTWSLSVGGAFEADDLVIDIDGFAYREDRLRIIEAALHSNWRGADGTQYSANMQLRQGLDAFGAGLQALDLEHDPRRVDFLLLQLSGTVYRRFATDWSLRFDGFAQQSACVLPDSERFKIGGDRLGRGFEVAEIAGDQGLGGKLELRRDLMNSEGPLGRLSAYSFYDIGAAWKQDVPGRESAATAGVGMGLSGSSITGYVEVAAPLTGADIEGRHHASVFAELSYRF
jgi:hemolysin activation/secretion protein